jgi:hypothetical protein
MFSNRVKNLGIFAALFLAVFSLPAAAGIAQKKIALGETRYFKNWAAGCDNTLSCQAIAMQPAENGEGYLTMSYTHDGHGISGPAIEITGMDADISTYRILINNRLITSGTLKGPYDSIKLVNSDAARLAKAIPIGNELRITDAAGKLLGRVSLIGSSAALRYVKSKNKRYGLPLPIINAKRIGKDDLIPDTGALVALAEGGNCTKERQGVTEDTAYSLGSEDGKARALALISCGNGAYNFSSAAFIGTRHTDGKWKFEPATFDYAHKTGTSGPPQGLLTNATWDAAKQTLSSYNKGRAMADCGMSEEFVWDGTLFRLAQAERMEKCQGAPVWITIWRAAVKFTT